TRTQRRIEENRQGEVCIEVRDSTGQPCAGVPLWAEQETHAFVFGCVAPDRGALPEQEWRRREAQLHEVFNRCVPARERPAPAEGLAACGQVLSGQACAIRVDVPDNVRLGQFQRELDRLASAGMPLEVWVRGQSVCLSAEADGLGADARAVAERVAGLYTLCF